MTSPSFTVTAIAPAPEALAAISALAAKGTPLKSAKFVIIRLADQLRNAKLAAIGTELA